MVLGVQPFWTQAPGVRGPQQWSRLYRYSWNSQCFQINRNAEFLFLWLKGESQKVLPATWFSLLNTTPVLGAVHRHISRCSTTVSKPAQVGSVRGKCIYPTWTTTSVSCLLFLKCLQEARLWLLLVEYLPKEIKALSFLSSPSLTHLLLGSHSLAIGKSNNLCSMRNKHTAEPHVCTREPLRGTE